MLAQLLVTTDWVEKNFLTWLHALVAPKLLTTEITSDLLMASRH